MITHFSKKWKNFIVLGSQNRKKESKMAVAKRQGREKPEKTEQKKVKRRFSLSLSHDGALFSLRL